MLNTRVNDITPSGVKLDNGTDISTETVVWAGGEKPQSILSALSCEHDKSGRIVTNNFLEVLGFTDTIMALGDCACITDPITGKPYPPNSSTCNKTGKGCSN